MEPETLSEKYRPNRIEDFLGNKETKKKVEAFFKTRVFPKTILLQGMSGCGKTTLARIIANVFGAVKENVFQYNISNTRGIDAAREIIEMLRFKSMYGDKRVVVLNECHKATGEFQNAMLEILEEPPKGVIFILCTTEPEKLLPTIKGNQRGLTLNVNPLTKKEAFALAFEICQKEGIKFSDAVLTKIVSLSEGKPRKVVTLLQSIISISGSEEEILNCLQEDLTEESPEIINLCKALLEGKPDSYKKCIRILKGFKSIDGFDPETARYAVLGYCSSILLSTESYTSESIKARASLCIAEFSNNFYSSKFAGLINACYLVCGA